MKSRPTANRRIPSPQSNHIVLRGRPNRRTEIRRYVQASIPRRKRKDWSIGPTFDLSREDTVNMQLKVRGKGFVPSSQGTTLLNPALAKVQVPTALAKVQVPTAPAGFSPATKWSLLASATEPDGLPSEFAKQSRAQR